MSKKLPPSIFACDSSLQLEVQQDDPCKPVTSEDACDKLSDCTWCKSAAVPSACYNLTMSKKLPPSIFACDSSLSTKKAPDNFMLMFETDVGEQGSSFTINVTRAWAPLGVDHLVQLVQDNFFNGAAFFRVVPGFVVQFGIAGTPAENLKWQTPILDDPVVASNTKGTITYATAGKDTRTTQLFINYQDNSSLDKQGFAPFGQVVKGMDVVTGVFNPTPGNSGGVDQSEYESQGNEWIKRKYPSINFITKVTMVEL